MLKNYKLNTQELFKYQVEYNRLISNVSEEVKYNKYFLFSPTLSKQETVTNLYDNINLKINYYKLYKELLISIIIFPIRFCWHFFNMLVLSVIYRINLKSLPHKFIYIRTWLVNRCFNDKILRDDYFNNLSEILSLQNDVITGFHPYGYLNAYKFLSINRKKNQIITLGFLSFFDIFSCFYDFIKSSNLVIKRKYYYDGIEVSKYIKYSIIFDFLKMRSFISFQENYITLKINKTNISAYLYVFENQAWEKVNCKLLNSNGIKTIGYQSSGFSNLFLNFFPTEKDRELFPYPNYILTVGNVFTQILKEYFPSKIYTFSALRFNHPQINGEYQILNFNSNILNSILYAFSVHKYQYKKIITILKEVFGESNITIILKFHPLDIEYGKSLMKDLPKNFILYKNEDLYNIKNLVDLVLFNDNSFGIESLIYGVKSFELNIYNNDFDKRMFNFHEWNSRIDINQLKIIRDQLINKSYKKFYNLEKIKIYINDFYKPFNNNAQIINSIINKTI